MPAAAGCVSKYVFLLHDYYYYCYPSWLSAFSFVSIGLSVMCAFRWFSLLHPSPLFGWVGWLMSAFYDICALEAYAHTPMNTSKQTRERAHSVRAWTLRAYRSSNNNHSRLDACRSFAHFSLWSVFIWLESAFEYISWAPALQPRSFVASVRYARLNESTHRSCVRAFFRCSFFISFSFRFIHALGTSVLYVLASKWKWYAKEAHSIQPLSMLLCTLAALHLYVAHFFFHIQRFTIPSMPAKRPSDI